MRACVQAEKCRSWWQRSRCVIGLGSGPPPYPPIRVMVVLWFCGPVELWDWLVIEWTQQNTAVQPDFVTSSVPFLIDHLSRWRALAGTG
jgi:hypothetical protein